MKKLFLILLITFGFLAFGYGQSLVVNGRVVASIPAFSLAADNSYTIPTPIPSTISIQYYWTGATATDASIVPYVSNYDSAYVIAADLDSVQLTTAAGDTLVHQYNFPTAERYLKLLIKHGTNTGGTLHIFINQNHNFYK